MRCQAHLIYLLKCYDQLDQMLFCNQTSDLIVEPFPSVPRDHSWTISNRVKVVEDFGIGPNWLGLRMCSTAGFTCPVTTNSSVILEMLGVKDIGLSCFLISLIGLVLGKGVTSANFHALGSFCSLKEALRMVATG